MAYSTAGLGPLEASVGPLEASVGPLEASVARVYDYWLGGKDNLGPRGTCATRGA